MMNTESRVSCFPAFSEKGFCMKSRSLCHREFFLRMSCLWGPPVALCINPALHPQWASTCEHSHTVLEKRLPPKAHIFIPVTPRGGGGYALS